jgi:hypothetical protein
MFTSTSPFVILRERALLYLRKLEEKVASGTLPSRAHVLAEIADTVTRFSASLDSPTMEVPLMGRDELLVRELVELPLSQAMDDLTVANEQITALKETTRRAFNLCQAERLGLKDNLLELTGLIDALRLWVSDSDPSFIWVGDSFNDRSKIDPGSSVFHDATEGVITLQPLDSISLSDKIVAAVIDKQLSAGGLPGNNSEIRVPGKEAFTGETPEPRPVLHSESGGRKDSLAALWDGNPDTWFEWERVYVDVPQPTIRAGKALLYDPSGKSNRRIPQLANWNCYIRYPGESQIDSGVRRKGYPLAYFKPEDRKDLRLGIEVALDQPRVVSWLRLTPLIRGGTYPEVEQILISTDGAKWEEILTTPTVLHPRMNRGIDFGGEGIPASNFEGVAVWALPSVPIRYLRMTLRQTGVYDAPLGIAHRFSMTPKKRKKTKGNVLVVGSHAAILTDTVELDFADNELETAGRVNQGFDIFKGSRQVIAIRDLLLEQRTYAAEGQFVSRVFNLERPVRTVSLLTTEQIPLDWSERRSDGEDWIAYQVSHDGQTWFDIIPQTVVLQESIVRFPEPTTALHFRATLTRPENDPTGTPILYSFALKCLPA